jgi:hypothetical protein
LPEDLVTLIKIADRAAAHIESIRLAGFSAAEAQRYFGRAPDIPVLIERDYVTPWPADVAQARYLERFEKLIRE